MEDLARLNKTDELYTNKDWYKVLKSRWSNYYDSLEKFWLKMFFRSKSGGLVRLFFRKFPLLFTQPLNCRVQYESGDIYLRKYEHFPEYYRAANLAQGRSFFSTMMKPKPRFYMQR